MKKVYTVTFHMANNYGAVLQAYALQKVLQRKYISKILNYDCKAISDGYKLFQVTHSGFKRQFIQFLKDVVNIKKNYCRIKNFNNYRKRLNLTNYYPSSKSIKNNYPKVDAYITGSDQVWNPKLTNGADDVYFLNFGHGEFKKISYAASTGSVETINAYKNDIIKYIKNIDEVSVREKKLKTVLESKINKEISQTVDPTLLLTKEEWLSVVPTKRLIKEKYIFVYCGKEPDAFYDIVNELAKRTGYLIMYSGRRDKENKFRYRKKSYHEAGPSEFVNLINNAEYVVTASFHGTALSIILNKKLFVVLNNYSDRLETLLRKFSMESSIINSPEDFEKNYNSRIDWNNVNKKLELERENSINWLYNAIEK